MAQRNITDCSRRFSILIVLLLVSFPTCWSMSIIEIENMFKDKRCIEGSVVFMPDGPVITTTSTQQKSIKPMQSITETFSDYVKILPKLQSAMNMLPNFSPNSSPKISSVPEQTPMNLINELARHNDIEYKYYLIKEDGPAHQKRFTIALQLGDEEYIADGTSLKKAQHAAAAKALSNTNFHQPPMKTKAGGKVNRVSTPAEKLQNLAMHLGQQIFYKEDALDNGHDDNEHCQLGNEYANMIDRNIGKSPISVVYEIGAVKKINVAFEVISTSGPDHAPVFGTRCTFGHLVADGTGGSKKKSKNDAATKMLLLLRMQPDQCIDESTQKPKRKRNKKKNKKKKKNPNLIKLNTDNSGVYNTDLNQIQQILKNMESKLSSLGQFSIKNFGTGSLKDKQSITQSIKPSSKTEHKSNMIEPKAIDNKIDTPCGNGNPLLPDMLEIGNQLNGKLNLNMDMYQTLAKDFLNADIEKAAGSLLRTMHANNVKQPQISPSATRDTFKDELLYMTDLLDVEVKFSDFPTASNHMYMSLVSLSTNPGRVCIGEGPNKELSQEKAAAEALFDLSEHGLDNIISRQD